MRKETPGQERLFTPESIADPRRVLIKLGSSSTTPEIMQNVADQCVWLRENGYQVVIVSSGAILRGRERTGLEGNSTIDRQSLSTVGQHILMFDWAKAFADRAVVAQELVHNGGGIHDDTFSEVLENNITHGWVTVVNYNDARNPMETEQDRINADNDKLTESIAAMMRPGTTIFLTGANGVLAADGEIIGQTDPNNISNLPLLDMGKTDAGTGGMKSKLESGGRIVDHVGGWGVITNAETFDARKTLMGAATATYIHPTEKTP